MSEQPKRKRLTISLVPTPAEIWAREQRAAALRQGYIEQMMTDAKDG